ncbi:MAG TPA: VWA domain-containing protein [Solirubrobacteraceae bacterium]|nr:VWA domain-containing protein [Solirubrobacteraceae bacterium]
MPGGDFSVETVQLDLPALAAAFGRRLRDAGLPVTAERSARLADALALVRPVARRRLYWTARSVLVTDTAQVPAFDAAFRAVFGGRGAPAAPEPEDLRRAPAAPDEREAAQDAGTPPEGPPAGQARSGAAQRRRAGGEDDAERQAAVPVLASAEEVLRGTRFEALDPHELAEVHRLMARLRIATPVRRTRRHDRSRRGDHIDLRRTLRGSMRTGGDAIRLARRRRRVAQRRVVMLLDISGSMEAYARAYLQFLTCAAGSGPRAEAFVFATRLTRLTRALGSRDPQRAIRRAAAAAPDWSSGTRIGDALKAFNDHHGRRGMARGAVIVILSDGWERGDPALVGREMERLARLAYRIVWVNPRAGASRFAPQAGGMAAALGHCDALLSGDSLGALDEVIDAIAAPRGSAAALAARWQGAAPEQDDNEPWASATPVPGSSVAMPSGYGPSRGRTTPGWTT